MSGATPASIGRYQILRKLGAGGMAEVFLARSTGAEGIEKVLVVKRVLPNFARSTKFRAMFVDEARVAMRLNHPNIVQVYDFLQIRDELVLAMELVDGLDLGRLVSAARRAGRRIPYELVAWIVAETAKGLDYAHNRRDEQGRPIEIVHRDVSPQNVLLSYDGVVKVADFGIARAKLVTEDTGVIKGKFSYMSPEQARGEHVDRRSDVYSLGIVLAELLMARSMFPGQSGLEVLEQARAGKRTLPRSVDPEVPDGLDRVVATATEFDREARYQSARSLANALQQWLHARDEIVDAAALEHYLAEIAPREQTNPDLPSGEALLAATRAGAKTVAEGGERSFRERRPVVVLTGMLRPAHASAPAPEELTEVRRVLADIAFKADALFEAGSSDDPRVRMIFGVGRVTPTDASRATRVALDIVDALEGLSADSIAPLTVSIGISRGVLGLTRDGAGRVLRYTAVGNVLDVADGLAREAAPKETLASGDVYRGARRDFAFDEQGERRAVVPGASETLVRVYSLRGAMPKEDRTRATPTMTRIVGRDEVLREIRDSVRDGLAQRRVTWLAVSGPLGIGKTAVINAALGGLDGVKPRVVRVECAFGGDVPFALVGEILEELASIKPTDPGEKRVAAWQAFVTEVFGAPVPVVSSSLEPLIAREVAATPAAIGDEQGLAVREAFRRLLAKVARDAPHVICVDALQWADAPSLATIASLVTWAEELPLAFIVASRVDARFDQAFGAVPRIDLAELSPDDAGSLARQRFGVAPLPPDLEQLVVERAGGNPLFVVELVDSLVERGLVEIEQGTDRATRVVRRKGGMLALPMTLEGAVAARIADLPADERRLLRWLAVVGAGMRVSDLDALSKLDTGPLLAQLASRGIVSLGEGGTWKFADAVVRHVAYSAIDGDDRARMHARVAELFRRSDVAIPPARLARHLERAGEEERAATAYVEAGALARAAYANYDALRLYAHALALTREPTRAFEAHEAREQILRELGSSVDRARTLAAMTDRAAAAGDVRLGAIASVRTGRLALELGDLKNARGELELGLERAKQVGARDVEVEALRFLAELTREEGDVVGSLSRCDDALELAAVHPPLLETGAELRIQRSILLRRIGRLEEALDSNAEALVVFQRLGNRRGESSALNALAVTLAVAGYFEDAMFVLRRAIRIDRALGDRFRVGSKLSNVGQLYFELGDLDRAEAFLEHALTVLDAIEDPIGRADALSALVDVQLARGSTDLRLDKMLDESRDVSERMHDVYDIARERLVRSRLELVRGDARRAAEIAAEGLERVRSVGVGSFEVALGAVRAIALAQAGDLEGAEAAAHAAHAAYAGVDSVESAERALEWIAEAFTRSGASEKAARVRAEAHKLVATRLARISDPDLRSCYADARAVQELSRREPD